MDEQHQQASTSLTWLAFFQLNSPAGEVLGDIGMAHIAARTRRRGERAELQRGRAGWEVVEESVSSFLVALLSFSTAAAASSSSHQLPWALTAFLFVTGGRDAIRSTAVLRPPTYAIPRRLLSRSIRSQGRTRSLSCVDSVCRRLHARSQTGRWLVMEDARLIHSVHPC